MNKLRMGARTRRRKFQVRKARRLKADNRTLAQDEATALTIKTDGVTNEN